MRSLSPEIEKAKPGFQYPVSPYSYVKAEGRNAFDWFYFKAEVETNVIKTAWS